MDLREVQIARVREIAAQIIKLEDDLDRRNGIPLAELRQLHERLKKLKLERDDLERRTRPR